MDSDLPFPTHFHRYVSETFRTENILQPEYHRFFRIIPASRWVGLNELFFSNLTCYISYRFLSLFSSDRSHMLRPDDRSWIKPPPNYPPICASGGKYLDHNVHMKHVSFFINLPSLSPALFLVKHSLRDWSGSFAIQNRTWLLCLCTILFYLCSLLLILLKI